MQQFITHPQIHNAKFWGGDMATAQEIVDYIHKRPNSGAVFRNAIAPEARKLRITTAGRAFDLQVGEYFVHNLTTDEIFSLPSNYFLEHFKEKPASLKSNLDL
jgi:hypothetical protein